MLKSMLFGAAILLATPVFADPVISPAAGSDQILAARKALTTESISFTFSRTITSKDKPVSNEAGGVTLGSDFTTVNTGTIHILDDFTLCRTLMWTSDTGNLDNQSCYYGPAVRLAELYNRRTMNGMLNAVTADKSKLPANLSAYWYEQELAIQEAPSDPLTVSTNATGSEYRLDDQIVARASTAGFAFSTSERQSIARYLARHTDLHPQILRAILTSGQLPAEITIERRFGDAQDIENLRFSDFHRQKNNYPLPPHLISTLVTEAKGDSIEARGLRQALAALEGTAQPPKPDFNTIMARMEAAIQAKHGMEANLLFQEVVQQYGSSLSDATRMDRLRTSIPALKAIFAEPEVASFVQASNLAGESKPTPQNEAAAKYLANAKDLDALPFGTFRYVTFANLVRNSGTTDKWDKAIFAAMPDMADCYWTHIEAYPWAGNAYKDLGDLAYEEYRTDKAWQAWDLGRAIDPDWRGSTLESVAKFEDRLRNVLPDNF